MLPPSLYGIVIALLVGLIGGGGSSWYWTATYKDARWGERLTAQQLAAEQAVRRTQAAAETESRAQQLYARQLEGQYADATDETKRVRAANVALAERLGGMRDPGKRPACRCPVPAPAAATGVPEPSGSGSRLSDEAAAFLLEFAADADRAAHYAVTCRAWAESLMTSRTPAPRTP